MCLIGRRFKIWFKELLVKNEVRNGKRTLPDADLMSMSMFTLLSLHHNLLLFRPCFLLFSSIHLICCPSFCPPPLLPSQCVVNLISELQEQMCRFQEEISTRIQEKRALEEREAQHGEPRGGPAPGQGPRVGSDGSNLSPSGSDTQMNNGGHTVHVGRLDG